MVLLLFSHKVLFDSLWTHGLQHTRLPCPSLSPRVYSNICPLSWWCYLTISPSPTLFSSCPQFFQYQGFFQWVGSLHQVAKILELQFQHQSFQWIYRVDFFLGFIDLISLQSKGLSRVFSSITIQKHNSSALSFLYGPTLTSIHGMEKPQRTFWSIQYKQLTTGILSTNKEIF